MTCCNESTPDQPAIRFRKKKYREEAEQQFVHKYFNGALCETEPRGFAEPRNRNPNELVVDATDGFIPLWAEGVTLRWRFQPRSMSKLRNPSRARVYLRDLLGQALHLWDYAVPVRFQEVVDAWDFEIVVSPEARCNQHGCTLASAFFPDGGQHELRVYPTMFEQSFEEQVETMAHELGHVFGLRHFFAKISERRWSSEIFGDHKPFSIMNYGEKSMMTETDRQDLKRLYTLARRKELTEINGTPIQLVKPFSTNRPLNQSQAAAYSKSC